MLKTYATTLIYTETTRKGRKKPEKIVVDETPLECKLSDISVSLFRRYRKTRILREEKKGRKTETRGPARPPETRASSFLPRRNRRFQFPRLSELSGLRRGVFRVRHDSRRRSREQCRRARHKVHFHRPPCDPGHPKRKRQRGRRAIVDGDRHLRLKCWRKRSVADRQKTSVV